jgi:Ca-activated chloride channel family protein
VSFQWPLALLLLALVPAAAVGWAVWQRRRERYASRFANPLLLANVVDRAPGRLRYLPLTILLVALAAMIVGVARPHAIVSVPREEATVVLAIDTSRSMTATDVRPTRLGAAREAAQAFVDKVPAKFRIGIVAFGSRAVVSLPPTQDRLLARQTLHALRPGEGTALGDAVVLGVELGQKQRAADGTLPPTAVLVISDGAAQGGRTTPAAAIRKARSLHVPVYSILVGTAEGVVTHTLTGGFTERIRVPPDPKTLQQVAQETGGRFFTARDDVNLREIYDRLGSRLGKKRESREVTDVFAAGSAGLLLAGSALSMLWFRRAIP